MKEWPFDLLIFGLLVIVISAFVNGRKVVICVPVGYIAGFIFAAFFNSDGVDQGGGTTNNGWSIWTLSFLIIIAMGIVWQIISKHIRQK